MAEYRESSGYCPSCQRRVVGRRQEASHTFWLLATLFSCGLFGIVWLLSSFSKATKPYHCSVCGTPLRAFPPPTVSASSGSPNPALIVLGLLVAVGFVGAVVSGIGGALKRQQSNQAPVQTVKPTELPVRSESTVQTTSKSYKQGYQKGFQEGKRWSRDPEQGMPMEEVLEPMSRNVAAANGKGSDTNWQGGWLDGFKNGFAAGRGGRR